MALFEIEFKIIGIEKKLMKYYEFASLGGDFGVISEPWINPNGHDFDSGFDKDRFTYTPYDLDCSYKDLKAKFKTIKSVYNYVSNDFRFDFPKVIPINDILMVTIAYEENNEKYKYVIDKMDKIEEVQVIDEFELQLKKIQDESINQTYENIDLDVSTDDLLSNKERKKTLKNLYKLLIKKSNNVELMRKKFHQTHNIETIQYYNQLGYDIDSEIRKYKGKLVKDVDTIRLVAIKNFFNTIKGKCYREEAINKTYSFGYDFRISKKGFRNFYKSVVWLFEEDTFYKALAENGNLPFIYSDCTFSNFVDVKDVYFGMVKKFPLSAKPIDCVVDKKYNKGLFL